MKTSSIHKHIPNPHGRSSKNVHDYNKQRYVYIHIFTVRLS